MPRASSSSRSSKPSSSRSKTSGSSSSSARGRRSYRSRSRSPRSHHRHRSPSSGRSSRRSPPSRRSSWRRSPGKRSQSPGKRSQSPGKRSQSPSKRSYSPDKRSSCSSDVSRDDLADGPIFSSGLSRPRSTERYSLSKETPSSPFKTGQNEDYCFRDDLLHRSKYSTSYNHLQYLPSEKDRYNMLLGQPSEDTREDLELPQYDRDDRLLEIGMEPEDFLPETWNFCKKDPSISPSLPLHDVDLRVLEYAGRKNIDEGSSRNFSQDPELKYLSRPSEIPAMPKKSILKKPKNNPSVQPEVFSSSSASIQEPPLLSDPPPFPQTTDSISPFSTEVVEFLKELSKNIAAERANTTSEGNVHNWKLHSGPKQNISHYKQNFGSFLNQREYHESTSEPEDQHSDFLLPHERASQDGNSFSHILSMKTDSTSAQKKNSFLDDVEDEEKFLYGDNGDDSVFIQRITLSGDKEHGRKKINSPPASPPIKSYTLEDFRPEHVKIYDLLKTIGLDIGVAEISKLAARTQERLHGKKASRSPDRHSVASHRPRKESRESKERHGSQSDTHYPESRWTHSPSPASFSPSKEMSPASHSEHTKSKTAGQDYDFPQEQAVPMASPVPSAPPCPSQMLPPPPPINPQYSVPSFLPFGATPLPPNYPPPTIPPPGYNPYGQCFTYAASGWAMYPPPQQADPGFPNEPVYDIPTVPPNPSFSNVIPILSMSRRPYKKRPVMDKAPPPAPAPHSTWLPQPTHQGTKEKIMDDKNRAAQKQKVLEEREKLKAEQEPRKKKLHYLTVELNRLTKQQGEMVRKSRKAEDPLLTEVRKLREKIANEVAQLQRQSDAAEKKLSELDKVAQILGIYTFEKAQKQSSENKHSSEKVKPENGKK